MQTNYREALMKIINSKIDALDDQNFFEYYSNSPILSSAFDIAGFIVAIDNLIDVEKSNEDISSRYTLNEDASFVQSVFDSKSFRDYFDNIAVSEPQGDNVWFLQALRNSIVHGGIQYIDLERGELAVKSESHLNNIDCTIPLDFFSSFMTKYRALPSNQKLLTSLGVELLDKRDPNFSHFQRNRDRKDVRYSYLVNVRSNDHVPASEVKKIAAEARSIFDSAINAIYGEIDGDAISEEVRGIIEKIDAENFLPKNSFKYKSQVKQAIGQFIREKVSSIFPQYQIDVREIQRPVSLEGPLPIVRMNLNSEISLNTYREKRSSFDFLHELEYLQNEFKKNGEYVDKLKEYLSPETQKALSRLGNYRTIRENMNMVLSSIHKTRTQQGLSHSYIDEAFDLLAYSDEHLSFQDLISRRIKRELQGYIKGTGVERIPDDVKAGFISKYSDYFEAYEKNALKHNLPSPEDKEVFQQLFGEDGEKLDNMIKYMIIQKSRMMVGLLYTYGINVYVSSKEQDAVNPADYDRTILSRMKLFTSERTQISQQQFQTKINSITRSITKLSNLITNPSLPQAVREMYQDKIDTLEIEKNQLILDTQTEEKMVIGGKTLTIDSNNDKKASVIRNCLAHNGRIRILARNKNAKETIISLVDSDSNGPTSAIRCQIRSILKFIELDYRRRFSVKYKSRPNSQDFEDSVGQERIAEGVQSVDPQTILGENDDISLDDE